MRDVCTNGPGHFLGHGQTLGLMEKEYVYPDVGDRGSPKEWIEQGSTDVLCSALTGGWRRFCASIIRRTYRRCDGCEVAGDVGDQVTAGEHAAG